MFDLTLALVRNTGLLAIVALGFGAALSQHRLPRPVTLGVLGGVGALVAMMDPTPLAPGVFVDSRAAPILLAGYFGGPVAGVIAVSVGSIYRLYLGGLGSTAGIMTILVAGLLGVACHWIFARRGELLELRPLVIVAALSPVTVLGVFFLPWDMASHILERTWLSTSLVRIMGILFLGLLVRNELRRLAAEAEVRRLAFTDDLSGLHNRRSFYAQLEAAWDRHERYGEDLSIVTIDVDRFKSINDRFGHPVGDEVIRRLGAVLREELRGADIPARLGGEEFAVLMPHTAITEAATAAERLRARLAAERIQVGGQNNLIFTASFGVAGASGAGSRLALLQSADTALYAAKATGRNRVVVAPDVTGGPALPDRQAASAS